MSSNTAPLRTYIPQPRNAVLNGDCIDVLATIRPSSIDFVLTDPPYLVRYQDRDGRTVHNDDNDAWLKPAFGQLYRVLKPASYCVSFYSWNRVDRFFSARNSAGFRAVGHLVFRKHYASGGKLLRYTYECAYLLAKGNVLPPECPIADVIEWKYTGNRLYPTQKPVDVLRPLIDTSCPHGGVVLDPFCGSGSTLMAAKELNRRYLGIEVDPTHFRTAQARLDGRAADRAA